MKNYNYIIGPTDTDSISYSKHDMSSFSNEEQIQLLKEFNDNSPEFIEWEADGYFKACLVLKAKNYILVDFNGKKTIKGSAMKDSKKPKIFQQYMQEIVELLLNEKSYEAINLYHKYVKEIMYLKDITPWVKKLTITDKITKCVGHEIMSDTEKKEKGIRLNETKVYDAVKHTDVQEGDKVYVYYTSEEKYKLAKEFDGDYSTKALLKQIHAITSIFKNVLDVEQFPKYHNKTNKKLLDAFLNGVE